MSHNHTPKPVPHTLADQIRELEAMLHARDTDTVAAEQASRLEDAIADTKRRIRRDKWHREIKET